MTDVKNPTIRGQTPTAVWMISTGYCAKNTEEPPHTMAVMYSRCPQRRTAIWLRKGCALALGFCGKIEHVIKNQDHRDES